KKGSGHPTTVVGCPRGEELVPPCERRQMRDLRAGGRKKMAACRGPEACRPLFPSWPPGCCSATYSQSIGCIEKIRPVGQTATSSRPGGVLPVTATGCPLPPPQAGRAPHGPVIFA